MGVEECFGEGGGGGGGDATAAEERAGKDSSRSCQILA